MKENFSSATTAATRVLSQAAIAYLESRGISGEVASRHGIYSDRHPEIGPSVVFPFFEGGKEVNAKWRTRDKDMRQIPNAVKTFYNSDAIDLAAAEDKFLLITEGEIDCLSAIEAGYPWTVSVPDGAPNQRHDGPVDVAEDKKFSFVWHCWDRLAKVKRVILAGDADTNGQNLNHELQRRLGPERCLFIEYPEGCKDLNDILARHGAAAVRECISRAKPYPIKGLYRLSEFTGPEYPETFHIGFGREMDMMLRVSLGQFMVVTGVPTHGKSQFVDTMLYHFARDHGWKSLVGTFESPPVPFWRDAMRQRVLHKSIRDMSMEERARADKFLNEHFIFLGQNTSADEDLDLSVDEIIDLARIAVIRDGIKVLCLDPWNEIEHRKRRDETGTDYTGRAIRQLKRFARLYNVLVIVVAHPRKPPAGNYSEPPSLYDIEGSSHWRNKPEVGLCIWRPDTTKPYAEVHIQKIKFRANGNHGVVSMTGDLATGTYTDVRANT